MEKLINRQPKKFKQLLQSDGHRVMPIIRFVSVSEDSNNVRVLIGGECPLCGSTHIRNTCNIAFCKEVMTPFLKQRFPEKVNSVKAVLTIDDDFYEVCSQVGVNVTYPLDVDEKNPFHSTRSFMLDKHPDIDGWLKLCSSNNYMDYPPEFLVSRRMCINQYTFKWIIDDHARMLLKDGTIAEGLEQIEDAFEKKMVMDGVERNVESAGKTYPVIAVNNVTMFDTNKYIVIE